MPQAFVLASRWIIRLAAACLLAVPIPGVAQPCGSCASLAQTASAYKTAESQLGAAEARITARLQDLAGKALSPVGITDAERADRTRLEGERQKITAARANVKKTLENLDKASTACARPCTGAGPGALSPQTAGLLDRLLAPPPAPPAIRPLCPECQAAADAVNAATVAFRAAAGKTMEVAKQRDKRVFEVDSLKRQIGRHNGEIAFLEQVTKYAAEHSKGDRAEVDAQAYRDKDIAGIREKIAGLERERKEADANLETMQRLLAEAQRDEAGRAADLAAERKALEACERERCGAPPEGAFQVPAWILGLDDGLQTDPYVLMPELNPDRPDSFLLNPLDGLADEVLMSFAFQVAASAPPPDPDEIARYRALCPACEPAAEAARSAYARVEALQFQIADIEKATANGEMFLDLLRKSVTGNEAANAKDRAALGDRNLSADDRRQKERNIELRNKVLDGAPAKATEYANKLRELREQRAALEKLLVTAKEAETAARDALFTCNRTRCDPVPGPIGMIPGSGGVTLTSVTGVFGNNPFNPPNPTELTVVGGGGTPQPPSGGVGTLQFNSASYGGAEGGAVLITVVRSGGTRGNVSVRYETVNGSATEGDYTKATGTLTWNEGDATPRSFSVALATDSEVEPVETFNVVLSNPGGGATLGSPSTATISITDTSAPTPPQPAGTLQFGQSAFNVMENAGTVTITVTRSGGSAGAVSVQYLTGPGSAFAGQDYTAVNGTLMWGTGDTGAKSFMVPIINDTVPEATEGFFVTLNNPTGGATLGAPSTATVTIMDDDAASAPCGATGNSWTPNAGNYACSGTCDPTNSPQGLSVNGDVVTITQFHGGGSATFQGCGPVLTSTRNDLRYFQQNNHTATISRNGNTAFSAAIRSSNGGMCGFNCTRTGP